MTLILREDDVRAVLTMPDTLTVLDAAFRADTRNVPRTRIVIPPARGVLHVLSAYVPGIPGDPLAEGPGLIGLKTYVGVPGKVRFAILLSDAGTGEMLAIIEADLLGQMRTGGASGVATRHMARPDATSLGVIGTGQQARTQMRAVAAAREVRSARVYGRDAARRETFATEMGAALGIPVAASETAEEAVREADIIVTMTTSYDPVLRGEWLKPGAHVNAAGSNWATRREVDDITVERAAVVAVDDVEQAKLEAGDLILPASLGRFEWSRAVELADIVAGKTTGRPSADAITLFKSIGIGVEDIAVAGLVYRLAVERRLGEVLPSFLP
ncbi:MAG TPA: ornithine cyclodeaminase family protein [Ktedonobacterales bacterium]